MQESGCSNYVKPNLYDVWFDSGVFVSVGQVGQCRNMDQFASLADTRDVVETQFTSRILLFQQPGCFLSFSASCPKVHRYSKDHYRLPAGRRADSKNFSDDWCWKKPKQIDTLVLPNEYQIISHLEVPHFGLQRTKTRKV